MRMIEEWRDIKGYEGLYRVSNLGNVWSCYVNRVLSKHLYPNGYYAVAEAIQDCAVAEKNHMDADFELSALRQQLAESQRREKAAEAAKGGE